MSSGVLIWEHPASQLYPAHSFIDSHTVHILFQCMLLYTYYTYLLVLIMTKESRDFDCPLALVATAPNVRCRNPPMSDVLMSRLMSPLLMSTPCPSFPHKALQPRKLQGTFYFPKIAYSQEDPRLLVPSWSDVQGSVAASF